MRHDKHTFLTDLFNKTKPSSYFAVLVGIACVVYSYVFGPGGGGDSAAVLAVGLAKNQVLVPLKYFQAGEQHYIFRLRC